MDRLTDPFEAGHGNGLYRCKWSYEQDGEFDSGNVATPSKAMGDIQRRHTNGPLYAHDI